MTKQQSIEWEYITDQIIQLEMEIHYCHMYLSKDQVELKQLKIHALECRKQDIINESQGNTTPRGLEVLKDK
jgi:hypothetical protein